MKLGDYTLRRTPHIIAEHLTAVDLSLATAEREHIERVLAAVDGNVAVAAKILRVSVRCLQRKGYRASRS